MTWTPLTLAFPKRYIDTEYPWEQFSLKSWNYDWREDPWGGLWDTLKPPAETVQDGRGDCEDYAFVVLSALYAESDSVDMGLIVCGKKWRGPSHVAAYGIGHVYSSGDVFYGTPEEWLAQSKYDWMRTRSVQ